VLLYVKDLIIFLYRRKGFLNHARQYIFYNSNYVVNQFIKNNFDKYLNEFLKILEYLKIGIQIYTDYRLYICVLFSNSLFTRLPIFYHDVSLNIT